MANLILTLLLGLVLSHKQIEETSQFAKVSEDTVQLEKILNSQPKDFEYYVDKYQLEAIWVVIFIFALGYLVLGCQKNDKLAQDWHMKALPVLKEQFAYVGLEDGRKDTKFEQISYNEFLFYASGRQNCYYSLFKMEMLHRQCAITGFLYDFLNDQKDQLTIEIPIRFPGHDPNQPSPVNLEFFICRNNNVQAAFKHHEHFKDFISQVKADNLVVPKGSKDYLVACAESEEAANQIIDKNIGEILSQFGDSLINIHITDQQIYNKYPLFLKARFYIDPKNHESALKMLKAIFSILDRAVKVKLSSNAQIKCERVRKKIVSTKIKEDQELKEQKLLDKKREEEKIYLEKLRSLPITEQRKLEEKKRLQELKQAKKKMQKMVKF